MNKGDIVQCTRKPSLQMRNCSWSSLWLWLSTTTTTDSWVSSMGDNFQLFCVKSEWNLCEQRQDNWQDKEKFPSFWSFFIIFTQFYPYFLTFCRCFAYIFFNFYSYNFKLEQDGAASESSSSREGIVRKFSWQDIRHWSIDVGHWILELRHWTLEFGLWLFEFGH